MNAFAHFIVRHRWIVLILTLGLAAWLGSMLIPLSGVKYDFSVRRLFDSSPDRVELLRQFKDDFGDDVGWVGVLYATRDPDAARGIFEPPILESMARVQDWLAGRPEMEIGTATSILDAADLHSPTIRSGILRSALEAEPSDPAALDAAAARLLDHEIYRGRLVSRAGDAALVMGRFDRDHSEERDREAALAALDALMEAERDRVGDRVTVEPLGLPVVGRNLTALAQGDIIRFTPIVLLVITVLLLFFFRSVAVTGVALGTVFIIMIAGVGLLQALGEPINIINNTIPTILMVVSIAEAIHLIERIQGERRAGLPPRAAAAEGTARMIAPCLLTMLTTAVGFGSLASAHIPILRNYGIFTAAAVLLAAVFNLTLIPAALSFGSVRAADTRPTPRSEKILGWIADRTIRHPRLIFGLFLAIMAGTLAYAIVGIDINSKVMEEANEENPVRKALDRAEARMSGVLTHEIYLRGADGAVRDPRLILALDRLDRALMEDPAFHEYLDRVDTLADLVREMGRGFHQGMDDRGLPENGEVLADLLLLLESGAEDELGRYASFAYDATRVSLVVRDGGSKAWAALQPRCEALLDELIRDDPVLGAQLDPVITGTMTYVDETLDFIIQDMITSVALAFLIIMVLMALLFRSLRAGLISMLPNVFPLIGTAGLMAVLGIPLRLSTLILFAICLGIAVDDTIHFLARFRQEVRAGRSAEEAIRTTMTTSGRAMALTTILLVAGFLVNISSDFLARQQFGFLAGVTLILALVGDFFLLAPCILLTRLDRVFRR
ncbi:MAG: MMPL family transporter [Pseudomonadota bacterium]